MTSSWDCIVVGGGAAGLSAALVLGRARRRTLLLDAGRQSNLPSHGIGGLLGQDGRSPADFYAAARRELARYPSVEVRHGEALDGAPADGGYSLELDGGGVATAPQVLLATGMAYELPATPEIGPRWGRSVFHCPFCHGWEARDRSLGVLDRSAGAVHRALLLRTWSDDVTVLTNGPSALEPEQTARLAVAGVAVDERPIAALRGPGESLEAVMFADGAERPFGGLLVAVTLRQRDALASRLGAVAAEPGPVAVDALRVDDMGRAGAPGLYAAGDVSAQRQSVANAVAAGSTAAAAMVGDAATAS